MGAPWVGAPCAARAAAVRTRLALASLISCWSKGELIRGGERALMKMLSLSNGRAVLPPGPSGAIKGDHFPLRTAIVPPGGMPSGAGAHRGQGPRRGHQEHRGGDARPGQTRSRWAALQPGDTAPSFRTSGGGIRWRTLPSDGSVLHHPVRGPGGGSRRNTFRPRCAPRAAAPRAGMRYARIVWLVLLNIHGGSRGAPLVVSAGGGIRAPRRVREPLMK